MGTLIEPVPPISTPSVVVVTLILFEPSYNLTPLSAVNRARLASASSIVITPLAGVTSLRLPVPVLEYMSQFHYDIWIGLSYFRCLV